MKKRAMENGFNGLGAKQGPWRGTDEMVWMHPEATLEIRPVWMPWFGGERCGYC